MKRSLSTAAFAFWLTAAAHAAGAIPPRPELSPHDQIKAARAKEEAAEKNGPSARPWDRDAAGKRPWERDYPPK